MAVAEWFNSFLTKLDAHMLRALDVPIVRQVRGSVPRVGTQSLSTTLRLERPPRGYIPRHISFKAIFVPMINVTTESRYVGQRIDTAQFAN